jgi:hypothetical protein
MAHTAFSKILKKHDKRTGYATRGQFMRNLVNLQSFARYPTLKQLLHEVEDMYRIISTMQSTSIENARSAGTSSHQPSQALVSPLRPVPTRSDIEEAKVMTMQAKEELDAELQPDDPHESTSSGADGRATAHRQPNPITDQSHHSTAEGAGSDHRRSVDDSTKAYAAASGGHAIGLSAFLGLAEAAAAAAPVPVPQRNASTASEEARRAKMARVDNV